LDTEIVNQDNVDTTDLDVFSAEFFGTSPAKETEEVAPEDSPAVVEDEAEEVDTDAPNDAR
jgi:hypothetical protein